jgi:membrane protease subunit (stomatin/prohibitin family)
MKIYDVIKNETNALNSGMGSKSVLAWKFTGEDFNNNSQLIVSEAEEAVFIREGIAEAVFGGGRYTLSTNNYPFIGRLRSMLSGGVSAFNCKVYFVNLDHKLELLWGTDSPIQMRDPVLDVLTSIQARGSFSIRVADSKKFLLKLIGNNIQLFTQEELTGYFRSAFLQSIKVAIASCVRESGQEILAIATELERIAEGLRPKLEPVLAEYGLNLVNFYVAAIDVPENEYRSKYETASADATVMRKLGDNWGRQQSANILSELAKNHGSGGVAAAGAAAGAGFAAGNVFGEMAGQMFGPITTEETPVASESTDVGHGRNSRSAAAGPTGVPCPSCGTEVDPGGKFCQECGARLSPQKQPCVNCHAEIDSSVRFCPNCGTPKSH